MINLLNFNLGVTSLILKRIGRILLVISILISDVLLVSNFRSAKAAYPCNSTANETCQNYSACCTSYGLCRTTCDTSAGCGYNGTCSTYGSCYVVGSDCVVNCDQYGCFWRYCPDPTATPANGCAGTGGGEGGGGSTDGKIAGFLWTDVNHNGSLEGPTEGWGPSSSACEGLQNDNFTISYGGTNVLSTWSCYTSTSVYLTANIPTGSATLTLAGLPTGYSCSNVSWNFLRSSGTVVTSGVGCSATGLQILDSDTENNLHWKLTTPTGQFLGRIWTDVNRDGLLSNSSEVWGSTANTCSGLKNDNFTLTESGSNRFNGWGCNAGSDGLQQSYYTSSSIDIGTRSVTLGGLPAGYTCANVSWSFVHSDGVTGLAAGTGCTASNLSFIEGMNNHLSWKLTPPNNAPAISLSPASISYSTALGYYPIRAVASDADYFGTLNIKTNVNPSTNGEIPFVAGLSIPAFGTISAGVYPIFRVYGWNAVTGNRVLIPGSETTVTGTYAYYYIDINSQEYSMFDIEFTNDYYDPSSGQDRNLYVGRITYIEDAFFFTTMYTVESEDFTKMQFDRGDPDDGYDLYTLPTQTSGDSTDPVYAALNWGGSLRTPVLWRSPTTAVSGTINFAVSDGIVASPTIGSVTTTPVTRNISGSIWTTANLVPNCSVSGTAYSGGGQVTAYRSVGGNLTTTINSNGTFNFSGVFGNIYNLCLSSLSSTPVLRLACLNGSSFTASGYCIGAVADATTSLNIGLRQVNAEKWMVVQNGDASADAFSLEIPARLPSSTSGLPYAGTPTSYYLFGNGSYASVLSSGSLSSIAGPTSYAESGVYAGGLSTGFRSRSNNWLQGNLGDLVATLNSDSTVTSKTAICGTSFNENTIYKYTGSKTIPSSGTCTYTVTNNGLSILVAKSTLATDTLILKGPILSSTNGRLLILTDMPVEIGAGVTDAAAPIVAVSALPSRMLLSVITSGAISFENYNNASTGSLSPLIVEGPLISGTDISIERDLGSAVNESYPAVVVRYNPLYITKLQTLAANNTLPLLDPLFNFGFSQTEAN